MKKAPLGFQNVLGGGPTQRDKLGRHQPALGCTASLKRLGHGSKILPQSSRLTCHQTNRLQYFRMFESKELCTGSDGAERSASARRMKRILIVAGRDGFGNLRFHLDTQVISQQ